MKNEEKGGLFYPLWGFPLPDRTGGLDVGRHDVGEDQIHRSAYHLDGDDFPSTQVVDCIEVKNPDPMREIFSRTKTGPPTALE